MRSRKWGVNELAKLANLAPQAPKTNGCLIKMPVIIQLGGNLKQLINNFFIARFQ